MKYLTTLLFFLNYLQILSQANLPTFFSFDTIVFPLGWSTEGTSFYTLSGNTPPSLKFDDTNDELIIQFEESPDSLLFHIVGNQFQGGEFKVEESQNGMNWSILEVYTNLASSYNFETLQLNQFSRYIRFKYALKNTGNVGLDDITITLGQQSNEQEIRIWNGNQVLKNGDELFYHNKAMHKDTIFFSIENIGLDTLYIDSVKIENDNHQSYTILPFNDSVYAGQINEIKIEFEPKTTGNHYVDLWFYSNDSDEKETKIRLKGIAGDSASEPNKINNAILFSNVTTYKFDYTFQNIEEVDGYLVLLSTKNENVTITDGKVYQVGDTVGKAKVIGLIKAKQFSYSKLIANSDYYVSVVPYYGANDFVNYAMNNQFYSFQTPKTMMPTDFYHSVNVNNSSFFISQLNAISNLNKQTIDYNLYDEILLTPFESRDTLDGKSVITCVYSGENKVFDKPFSWIQTGFSREHTFCHSWMPTYPCNYPEKPEYQDLHHLFPTQLNQVNSLRGNFPLGEVVSELESYKACKIGYDVSGNIVFEPRNQQKGDAARALMYMSMVYYSLSSNWSFPNNISDIVPYGQSQETLKKWHFQDLPDNYEIARNDFIESIQGNRNPFIDNPDFACHIDFSNMTYLADCGDLSVNKNDLKIHIYPNPVIDRLTIASENIIHSVKVINSNGQVLDFFDNLNLRSTQLDFSELETGFYYLKVEFENGREGQMKVNFLGDF